MAFRDTTLNAGTGGNVVRGFDMAGKVLPISVLIDSSGNEISPATQTTLASVLAALQGTLTVSAGTVAVSNAFALDAHITDGSLRGTVALSAGSAVIGHVIVDSASLGTVAISAASLPLPSGAATAANQSSEITALGLLATQATAASILAALQGTLTIAGAVTQSGSWTVAATQSGTWALGTSSAVIGHVIVDSGAVAATQSGTWNIGSVTTLPAITFASPQHVIVDSTTGTVTISGAVTIAAGTAVIGHVITDSGSTTAVTGNVAVTNAGLTNLDVALSTLGTQTTLAAILAKILAAPATEAKQDTANTSLASIKTNTDKIPTSPSTDRTTAGAPFSVELSDGSAFYTGAKTGQLPTAVGQTTPAGSVSIITAKLSRVDFSAVPTTGVQLVTGACNVYFLYIVNASGGTVFGQLFEATSTRADNTIQFYSSGSTATLSQTVTNIGSSNYGAPMTNVWLQFSTLTYKMTAQGSTAMTGFLLYAA